MAQKRKKAPWKRSNPKKKIGSTRHLTASQKAAAKRRARKAGRPYPNLVDNMRAAASGKKSKKKKARKKPTARNKAVGK